MSEELLVRYCSPTLAGLKTANMFSCSFESRGDMLESIRRLNRALGGKGVRVMPLRFRGNRGLIYVYRPEKLSRDLSREGTECILSARGYCDHSAGRCIGLFGSYGWGDGEWMRNWEATCKADGAVMACDFVICNEAPDGDAAEACKELGAAVAR